MTISHVVVEDRAQPPNRRVVRVEFTHVESGLTHTVGPMWVPTAYDLAADITERSTRIEEKIRRAEKRRLLREIERGRTPTSTFFTSNQITRYAVRLLLNIARDEGYPERERWIALLKPYLDSVTNAQLAAGTGWTTQQATDARAKIDAFVSDLGDLDHGNGELDEDG